MAEEDVKTKVSPDDVGKRMFELMKEKAVERAMDDLRKGLKDEWNTFSHDDILTLREALEEAWVRLDRNLWLRIDFKSIDREKCSEIISRMRELQRRGSPESIKAFVDVFRGLEG